MAITLSNTFTDNLLWTGTQGVATQIGGGTLVVWASGGSPPAGPNEATTGSTQLASFTFSAAASQNGGSAPTTGSMTLAFSTQTVTAIATGTADYFRINNSAGTALIQGTIGTTGADWNISSTTVTTGDQIAITGTPTISWVTS